MKINFFNNGSPLYPYRWIIISTSFIILFMLYHTLNGGRMLVFKSQEQWSSSGPGAHK